MKPILTFKVKRSFFTSQCLSVLVLFMVALCFSFQGFAYAKGKPNHKYASFVVDADTGAILHERYADKKLHPASLTKVMTLVMLFDALDQGKMDMNSRIQMSRHSASMAPSKIGLKPGESIKAKDAIMALVTKSANDIAAAVAESIGGTESNFARMMTRKAHAIGMTSTVFRNASGLHDPAQVTTARDMAIMAQYVINTYPEYYKFFSRKNFTYQGQTYRNHNGLMNSYEGMDGMKTGFIQPSGFNLVASAVRNNRRIIGVVFGGRSAHSRNDHMASLLDEGFRKIGDVRIAKAPIPLPARKPDIVTVLASAQSAAPEITPASFVPTRDIAMAANERLAAMGRFLGEGDYDYDKMSRVETGMLAIAAHTGRDPKPLSVRPTQVSLSTNTNTENGWAIQVGAFTSRAKTDAMLVDSMKSLPSHFVRANPVIAPLKTQEGWLFRGRLAGFTQAEAKQACSYFRECMAIAPENY